MHNELPMKGVHMSNRCKKAIKCGSALGCASLGVVMALSFSPFAQGGVHGAFADDSTTPSEQPQQQSYDFKIGKFEYTVIGNRNTFVEVGITKKELHKLLIGNDTVPEYGFDFFDDTVPTILSQFLAKRFQDGNPGFTKEELSTLPEFKEGAQPVFIFKQKDSERGTEKVISLENFKEILDENDYTCTYENTTNINEQFPKNKKPAFVIRDDTGNIYKDKTGKEGVIPLNILGYHLSLTGPKQICDESYNCKPVVPEEEALLGRGAGNWWTFPSAIKGISINQDCLFIDKQGEVYKFNDSDPLPNNKPDIKLTKDDVLRNFVGGSKETNPFYNRLIALGIRGGLGYDYDAKNGTLNYKGDQCFFSGLLPDCKVNTKIPTDSCTYLKYLQLPSKSTKQEDKVWAHFPTKAYVYFKTKDGIDVISTFHGDEKFNGLICETLNTPLPQGFTLENTTTSFADKELTFNDGNSHFKELFSHIDEDAWQKLRYPRTSSGASLKVSDVLERLTDNPQEKNDYTKPGLFIFKSDFFKNSTANTYAEVLNKLIFAQEAPLHDKFLDTPDVMAKTLREGCKEADIKPYYVLIGKNIAEDSEKVTFGDGTPTPGFTNIPTPSVYIDGKDFSEYMDVSYIDDRGKETTYLEKPGAYKLKVTGKVNPKGKNLKDCFYSGNFVTTKQYFIGAQFGFNKEMTQDFKAAHEYTQDAPYKMFYTDNVAKERQINVTIKKKNPSGSVGDSATNLKATLDRDANTINIIGSPEKGATYVVSLNVAQENSWVARNNTVELTAVESAAEPKPQLIGTLPDILAGTPLNQTLRLLHNNMPAGTEFTATLKGEGSDGLKAEVSADKTKVTVSGTPKNGGKVTLLITAKNGEKTYKSAPMEFTVTVPAISLTPINDFQQGTQGSVYCHINYENAKSFDYTVSVTLEGDAAQGLNVLAKSTMMRISGTPTNAGTVTLKATATKKGSPDSILTAETTFKVVGSAPAPEPPASEPTLTINGDVTGAQVGKEFNIQIPFSSTNMPADAELKAALTGDSSEGLTAEVSADKTKVTVSGTPKKDGKVTLTLTAKKGDTTLKTATKEFSVAASETAAPAPSPSPLPGGSPQAKQQAEPEKKKEPKEEAPVPSFDQATKRIAGNTAEDTMKAIVETAFPDPVKEVVLATSEGYWDALSANSLAGSLNAPVLLTHHGALPEQTIAELKRLKTSKVVVCGGENAISNDVVAQLKELNIEVERVAGQMASDTANDIAQKLANTDTAVVATSWGYEDALSAASFAYAKKAPIFLANYNTATLDASNIQTMKDKGVKKVYIVGGTAVVSPEVEAQLSAAGIACERVAGDTAYDTSAKLATKLISLGMSANNMAIATGWSYADALAGAALCGKQNSVMVLADNTNQTAISEVVAANKQSIKNYYIFGGTSAVGENATNALKGVFTGKDASNEKGDSKGTK